MMREIEFEDEDSGQDGARILELQVTEAEQGLRLDKAIAQLAPEYSRSRLQALIQNGALKIDGQVCTEGSRKIKAGAVLVLDVPPLQSATPLPENIPLDIVYEDDDLLVINKPIGLVVHPGAGNYSGTLVNALLHHCGDTLSGIGGVMRPGIVHRLDKDTSGLMVVAKHDQAHQGLSAQLEDRSLSRVYEALVLNVPVPIKGTIDRALGRDPRNRLRMVVNGQSAREARTHYLVLQTYEQALSLVECRLESGRTHQIRVHMQSIKHPLIGDPLYGPQDTAVRASLKKGDFSEEIIEKCLNFPRQALHARQISFIHPMTENEMSFEAERPEDFYKLLNLFNK